MKKKIRLEPTEKQVSSTPMQQESKKVPFEQLPPVELIKRFPKYQFGNRPDYYERRGSTLEGVDSRLLILDKSYFEDKKILDVGCHEGILTLQIAKHFNCRYIKGIDIDYRLINEAVTNWTKEENLTVLKKEANRSNEVVNQKLDIIKNMPKNIKMLDAGLEGLLGKRNQAESLKKMDVEKDYPHNVSFEIANILDLDETREKKKYDTIVCFSLTKWIHLNYGDEGIKKMFQKIKMALSKGGLLILEVQKFKSYSKKVKEYPRFKEVYPEIHLHPEHFDHYLKELGFKKLSHHDTLQKDDFKRDVECYELIHN